MWHIRSTNKMLFTGEKDCIRYSKEGKHTHLEDDQLCSIISVSNKTLYEAVLSHYINTNHPHLNANIKFLVLSPSSRTDFGVILTLKYCATLDLFSMVPGNFIPSLSIAI